MNIFPACLGSSVLLLVTLLDEHPAELSSWIGGWGETEEGTSRGSAVGILVALGPVVRKPINLIQD